MSIKKQNTIVTATILFISILYVTAQDWEPFEGLFTRNTDYLLQQVVALEHPNLFKKDFIYHDLKYVTWNPQGMIYATRLIYKITNDPFSAIKYLAFFICLIFVSGYYLLFKEIMECRFWGLFLAIIFVIFYDQFWGNGFGMPCVFNFWARVFFNAILGWLIFYFIIIIEKPKHWPIFGLLLGITGALIHPKPTLAWAGAFTGSIILKSLRFQDFRLHKVPKITNITSIFLMILGILIPILLWAIFQVRIFEKPDYATPEIITAISNERSSMKWYIWQIFPIMLDNMKIKNEYFGRLCMFTWAFCGLFIYAKQKVMDAKINILFLSSIVFFFIIIVVPSLEYLIVQFTAFVPNLSPLSVNFSSLKLWLLILGAPGIAIWTNFKKEDLKSKDRKTNIAVSDFSKIKKRVVVCLLLIVMSINLDVNTAYGWSKASAKRIIYTLHGDALIKKLIGRDTRLSKKLKENMYFRDALEAAKKTPEGSLFYCYNAMNYVRVGALRPVVYSVDDIQKCVVSKVTYDKYPIAKNISNFLKNNPPESLAFSESINIYRKLGAEYVFDKRTWPQPKEDSNYKIFFQNRNWTIIKLLQ